MHDVSWQPAPTLTARERWTSTSHQLILLRESVHTSSSTPRALSCLAQTVTIHADTFHARDWMLREKSDVYSWL